MTALLTPVSPAELTKENTHRVVNTESGTIHYHEAGTGYPLIMLHGSGPGATGWSNFGPNMLELSKKYRVIAPDMPGWGASDPVSFDDRNHVKAAVDFMDALGIEKAAFMGNSMGGATVLRFAMAHPDRISHIITMGSGAGASANPIFQPAGPSEGIKVLQGAYRDPSVEGMRKLVDIMTFDPAFATEELVQQRSETARSRPDHLENFINGIPKGRLPMDLSGLARTEIPALIVHGRDDRVVHYEHGLRLATLIPNSRLLLLNRCGHWAQVEHPAEFNRAVDSFLETTR
ncbi:alpha/beta fold hydrolase [Granulicoccus sp. GXG6511]|uniref:alpha/beta fold hydrolase n=1 Tax=Granulicoccus sp. GXG6511 TaxID=3381351 RepID=UPI003D7D4387